MQRVIEAEKKMVFTTHWHNAYTRSKSAYSVLMGQNPYSGLPKCAFWKTGVTQGDPYAMEGIYKKKFTIPPHAKIATAGSCFAQHITHHLRGKGCNVLDVEPPPPGLAENFHHKYGFMMYSARYGNIYTVRQLLQLALEAADEWKPKNWIWEKNGKYIDGLRPAIEPEGLDSPEEVLDHRRYHLSRVKELLTSFDLFIFTLGLTEMWAHTLSGTVFPSVPGLLGGEFEDELYEFKNAQFSDILADFDHFQTVLNKIRGGKPFKIILTVSPVPLTATATGQHVLLSNTHSKSILRSVAGQLSMSQEHIDYFPAYEIVTNPRLYSTSFRDNLRSVQDGAVANVMNHFFAEHSMAQNIMEANVLMGVNASQQDLHCEEALIEEFGE
jgi:hypothetical protein